MWGSGLLAGVRVVEVSHQLLHVAAIILGYFPQKVFLQFNILRLLLGFKFNSCCNLEKLICCKSTLLKLYG